MRLKAQIENDTRDALKNREQVRLATLRMLRAAIQNKEIDKRTKLSKDVLVEKPSEVSELTDEEVVVVIRSEIKKRRDSVVEFERGNRKDLVEKETAELKILETYLPPELSDQDIERIAREVIASVGGENFGRVMGEVMKRIGGQASGERVSAAVRRILEK